MCVCSGKCSFSAPTYNLLMLSELKCVFGGRRGHTIRSQYNCFIIIITFFFVEGGGGLTLISVRTSPMFGVHVPAWAFSTHHHHQYTTTHNAHTQTNKNVSVCVDRFCVGCPRAPQGLFVSPHTQTKCIQIACWVSTSRGGFVVHIPRGLCCTPEKHVDLL